MPDSAIPNANRPIANASDDAPPKDQWTLMFLIMGDASLSASMISQLKELNDSGYQEHANVLLYFDPNCNGKRARIYDVNSLRKTKTPKTFIGDGENPFVRNIAQDRNVQSLDQTPAALALDYFLTYSRTYYPAKNYMLFLMGHGVIAGNDEFLPDTDDGSSVTLADLGVILKAFGEEVRKTDDEFHLVGFHSCGMSSVELAFELQNTARYMLATQGSAFPGSWPYRQLLKKIFNSVERILDRPEDPYPNELIKEILEGLQDLSFYNGRDFLDAGFSADLTMCSLDQPKLDSLKAKLEVLVSELKKGLTNAATNTNGLTKSAKDAILLAHLESQSYFGESYTDLYDFCECLQKHRTEGDKIREACSEVIKELKHQNGTPDPQGAFDRVIVFTDYYGPAFQHSNGLSIYFPWSAPLAKVMNNYDNYRFTKDLGSNSWISFLRDYFHETKRLIRDETKVRDDRSDQSTAPLRAQFEKLPDRQVLRLGPPPQHRQAAVDLRKKWLKKDMLALVTNIETLVNQTAAPAEHNKATTTLPGDVVARLNEINSLAREIGLLAELDKETAILATKLKTLRDSMTTLEKETATLEGIGKETASLAKETATLAKETATLADGGSAANVTGSLAKETATLAKETGSLAKEMASLGRFGFTVIKNFDVREDPAISSRPRGEPNSRKPRGTNAAGAAGGG